MHSAKTISVLAEDNLTGIKSWRGTIDGKWVLAEYDYKKRLFFYQFDKNFPAGKHVFELEIRDRKENIARYKAEFLR